MIPEVNSGGWVFVGLTFVFLVVYFFVIQNPEDGSDK